MQHKNRLQNKPHSQTNHDLEPRSFTSMDFTRQRIVIRMPLLTCAYSNQCRRDTLNRRFMQVSESALIVNQQSTTYIHTYTYDPTKCQYDSILAEYPHHSVIRHHHQEATCIVPYPPVASSRAAEVISPEQQEGAVLQQHRADDGDDVHVCPLLAAGTFPRAGARRVHPETGLPAARGRQHQGELQQRPRPDTCGSRAAGQQVSSVQRRIQDFCQWRACRDEWTWDGDGGFLLSDILTQIQICNHSKC